MKVELTSNQVQGICEADENNDPFFTKKCNLYKTAYSSLYRCYVEILKVSYSPDDTFQSNPLFKCRLAYTSDVILFNKNELSSFCL